MGVEESKEDRAGWAEVCRREVAIRDLINGYPKRLEGTAIDDVAWELGVSRAPSEPRSCLVLLRPTASRSCLQVRSTVDPKDDAVTGWNSSGWADRDDPTDAGVRALRQPPPSHSRDQWCAVAELDGGMAYTLPGVWDGDAGRSASQPADQSRSRPSIARWRSSARATRRIDDGQCGAQGTNGQTTHCPHAEPPAATSVSAEGSVTRGANTKAARHGRTWIRSVPALLTS